MTDKRDGDILSELGEDARRLRAGQILPPDGILSVEQIKRVRADLEAYMLREGVTAHELSRRLGDIPAASINELLRANAVNSRRVVFFTPIARAANAYIEQQARRGELPRPGGFVQTEVARRILTVIRSAITLRTIGLITGPAGVGKSMTLEAATAVCPGAILVRVRQDARTPRQFAILVARRDGLRVTTARGGVMQSRVLDHLKDSQRPLFIDEAHRLDMETLEYIRDLHDVAGSPIVLAGTYAIRQRVEDADELFGQFSSRIGLRYDIAESAIKPQHPRPLYTVDEIRRMFESGQVRFTDDGLNRATELANTLGLGSLRLVRRVVEVAASLLLATGKAGVEARIDTRMIDRVLVEMHGVAFQHMVARRVELRQAAMG